MITDKELKAVLQMYLTTSNFKVEFLTNERNNSKKRGIIMEYLQLVCYGGKRGKEKLGFLNQTGHLDELIDRHNRGYTYLVDKKWKSRMSGEEIKEEDIAKRQIFTECEATNNQTPIKISNLLQSFEDKFQSDDKFLFDFRNEFSSKKLSQNTNIELLAKCMHWTNKSAKYVEQLITDNNSPEEIKRFNNAYKKVSSVDASQLLVYYVRYNGLSKTEIENKYGNEQYEKYMKLRKKVNEIINKNSNLKGLSLDDFIEFIGLKRTKAELYSNKHLFNQRLIYEIEKNKPQDVIQYIRRDESHSESDPYKYVYGVAIDGYTEPFEVHICSNDIDPNRFGLSITLAEGMLKSDGISKKIKIPIIKNQVLVKTSTPFKMTGSQINNLIALTNNVGIKQFPPALDAVEKSKVRDDIKGAIVSPQLAVINQTLNCMRYMSKDLKETREFYTCDGIEEKEK